MTTASRRFGGWRWIAAGWIGLGVFDALQTVFVMHSEGMHHVWGTLFAATVCKWLPWALATPLVVRLGRRYPPITVALFPTWAAHAVLCLAIGLIFAFWTAALEAAFNPFDDRVPTPFLILWSHEFQGGVLSSAVLYAVILAVSYASASRERLANQELESVRLSAQLTLAQLDALRQQIEPHFLFNALNAVAALTRSGKTDEAISMIAELSDFLRRSLDGATRQHVPLGDEMQFAQKYLRIQQMRFSDRLRLNVDVPHELASAQVPSLILQPLVENAVKHGIAQRPEGGTIAICASRTAETLTVRISNDGPPLHPQWNRDDAGIGLANVRTRLQTLYGSNFALDVRNSRAGGVEVALTLPFTVASALER